MNKYRIAFQTPDFVFQQEPLTFNCITYGSANRHQWINPNENTSVYWDEELTGTVLSGKFDEVLTGLKSLKYNPKICIAVFTRNPGTEQFINRFLKVMPGVAMAGGIAAISENDAMQVPEDVRILAVAEGLFEFQWLNIYEKTGTVAEIKKMSSRDFNMLRIVPGGAWQDALGFYRSQQKETGLDDSNFESLTFSDGNDRNMHFSVSGNCLHAGADLPEDNTLFMRITSKEEAEKRVAAFLSGERSLIFGCAGIRSLIQRPLFTGRGSMAGFMFGEIVAAKNKPVLGNLMLTKIKMLEKEK